jgi:Replication-relaxation
MVGGGREHAMSRQPLPKVGSLMLAGIYEHRLLSTLQLQALYTPNARPRWAREVLVQLEQRSLVDRVHSPRRLSLWFLTEAGADAVEQAGQRGDVRRKVSTHEQAEGPLKAHTIAVNQVGVEFVKAARDHGDECGSDSWRNEVAHPITQPRGRRPAELVIADALLTYLQTGGDGALALHQRFVELDRGTRTAEQLASKITRYARLRHFTPGGDESEPLWRNSYRAWPQLLVVLADQSRTRMRQRVQRALALHASDPRARGSLPVSFVALDALERRGPFSPIFLSTQRPDEPVDWLGQTRPEENADDVFH